MKTSDKQRKRERGQRRRERERKRETETGKGDVSQRASAQSISTEHHYSKQHLA